ncbi:MaoC family dehydratase N-terminal domain-containing protein [Streptosporangium sp. NPDC002544]|uniref:FAS1-like dehydratase domain-containing protein n=1 Tax=Streptosporangium sp. NPDC002544 TaxID=3154538 RepID=UPI00331B82CA
MVARRFPIEAGHIAMFARAIGDQNPVYYEESASDTEMGGVIAPPTFVMAAAQFDPEWGLRPQPGRPWMGSGRTPSGTAGLDGADENDGGTGLHAEQHFTYHRPIRPGDVLTGESREGERWEKQGKRGGALKFSEIIVDYRDADGELVVTSRMVGVRTERAPSEGEA